MSPLAAPGETPRPVAIGAASLAGAQARMEQLRQARGIDAARPPRCARPGARGRRGRPRPRARRRRSSARGRAESSRTLSPSIGDSAAHVPAGLGIEQRRRARRRRSGSAAAARRRPARVPARRSAHRGSGTARPRPRRWPGPGRSGRSQRRARSTAEAVGGKGVGRSPRPAALSDRPPRPRWRAAATPSWAGISPAHVLARPRCGPPAAAACRRAHQPEQASPPSGRAAASRRGGARPAAPPRRRGSTRWWARPGNRAACDAVEPRALPASSCGLRRRIPLAGRRPARSQTFPGRGVTGSPSARSGCILPMRPMRRNMT